MIQIRPLHRPARRPRMLAVLATATAGALLVGCGATSEPAADESEDSGPQEEITVTDSRGEEVVLDGPAERVAATEWNAVEYAASLGVMPVGVSDVTGFTTWDSAVELDDDVTDIGTRGEPSIDSVASLGLDVLFVTDSLVGNALEQIERTTPVIVLKGGDAEDPVGAMWANLELVAQATGTEDRLAELREEFDAKVEETAAVVEESGIGDAPVAFSDAYEASGQVSLRPYGEGSLLGGVMGELGLDNAWSQVDGLEFDPAYGLAQTDVEGLSKLPDDTRFWYIANDTDGGDPYAGTLADNRVWTGLPFVEAGDTYRFPDAIWMFGGPASMMQFLDAVQDAVAETA